LNEVVTSTVPSGDTGWNDNSRVGLLSSPLKTRGFPRHTEISGLNQWLSGMNLLNRIENKKHTQ
jgi:hypothetical protein